MNFPGNTPEKPELRDKLLIVRSIGDETGALPAFYVASWYISRKSEGFERRYPGADALSESESKRIRNLVYGFFSSVRNRPVDGFKPSIVRDTSVCGALDFVCLYSGMDTAARGGLPESPFASLHRFRSSFRCIAASALLGRERMFCALYANVMTESAPPGRWTVVQLGPNQHTSPMGCDQKLRLAHSAYYADTRVLEEIANWILAKSSTPH